MKISAVASIILALTGCSQKIDESTIEKMEREISEISKKQIDIQDRLTATVNHQTTIYTITDVNDSKRRIPSIGTTRSISVGERIFIGDDMYDVKAIKNFTSQSSESNQSINPLLSVEILVTFEGKAKTREKSD